MAPQLIVPHFPDRHSASHPSKMIIPNEQDAPQLARRGWLFGDNITPGYMTPQGGGAFTFGGFTSMQMFLMGGFLVIILIIGVAACAGGGGSKKTSTDEEAGDDDKEEEEEEKDD